MIRKLTVATIALFIAGCGASGSGNATTVDPTHTATIRITQDQTDCCYTEGQISFLSLSSDGGAVIDRGYAPAASTSVLAQVAVEPGTYVLESWQRPCSASCPDLDEDGQPIGDGGLDAGRAEQCSIEVVVTDGERSNVLITWAPGAGCEITLPETQPSSDVPDEIALRAPYPTCGTDYGLEELAYTMASSSTVLPNEKRRCFLDAYSNGKPAELNSYEPTEDPTILRHLIYRTGGDDVEVFFEQATNWGSWSRYTCTGLEQASTGYEFETMSCSEPEALN